MKELGFRQIHLDFHTFEGIEGVGEDFDPDAFAATLKEAGVNSINLFARCHHGQVYYDSSFKQKHPHLQRDLLREQVEACREAGIATPIYVTAGWDEDIARTHPEWLERDEEGKPFGSGPFEAGWKKLCYGTPYVDYLEAQILDMLHTFGDRCDGAWIDIVFQNACCCEFCKAGMLAKGMDPEQHEQRERYATEVLEAFKFRISEAVRNVKEDCLIFYNSGHVGPFIRRTLSAYTHLEIESLPGPRDAWGYEHFPITVRYVKTLGVEYVGMTGKFHKVWGDFGGFKNLPALEYDCFAALAHGAKCCIGDQLHPSGKLEKVTYDLIGKVYRQVEAKEPWCRAVESVSEVGLFTPEDPDGARHFRLHPSLRGAYRMLEEAHLQFDVVDAESRFEKYAVVLLPDVIKPDEALVGKLEAYIAQGGKVLLSHQSLLDDGAFALDGMGVEVAGVSEFTTEYMKPVEPIEAVPDTPVALYGRGMHVTAKPGATVLAELWSPYFERTWEHFCSHFQSPYEKPNGFSEAVLNGNVAYLAHPLFEMYHLHGTRAHKMLALHALNRLLPERLVVTDAPTTAHINLNYQPDEKRHVLHILHYIPEARSKQVDIIEDVIPLYRVQLAVTLPEKPQAVYLAPSEDPLDFQWRDGRAVLTVPEVRGHQMVVFEQG